MMCARSMRPAIESGRKAVGDEVVKLVVPSLQRFTQKQKEKEFSKSKISLLWLGCDVLTHVRPL